VRLPIPPRPQSSPFYPKRDKIAAMRTSTVWTGVDHYENFPVASRLVPASLRPAVVALYHFARCADDIADEGELAQDDRLRRLAALRVALEDGSPGDADAPAVVLALRPHIERHGLPPGPLLDLLSAFEQDVRGFEYRTRADLLDYCRRSANPVGRLLLHLFGVEPSVQVLDRSDSICTALQLINFLQDLRLDLGRGRFYLPEDRLATRGIDRQGLRAALVAGRATPALRDVIAAEANWAKSLILSGAPLARQVPWRLGLELRAIIAGGLRILEQLEQEGHDPILARPRLSARDAPALVRLFLGACR
jgi:squalene synthase HpnC